LIREDEFGRDDRARGNTQVNRKVEHLRREGAYVGEERKFGYEAHPSVTQENTYTEEEMSLPEFQG
jgi:biotin operon repressor